MRRSTGAVHGRGGELHALREWTAAHYGWRPGPRGHSVALAMKPTTASSARGRGPRIIRAAGGIGPDRRRTRQPQARLRLDRGDAPAATGTPVADDRTHTPPHGDPLVGRHA